MKLTKKQLTQKKRENTIELRQWRERLAEILMSEASQSNQPLHKQYYHGKVLWIEKEEAQREIEYCEFRVIKFNRMSTEVREEG